MGWFSQDKCRSCGTVIPKGNVCLICKRENKDRGQNEKCPKCKKTMRRGVCPTAGCGMGKEKKTRVEANAQLRPTKCPLCGKITVRSGVCGNPRCP